MLHHWLCRLSLVFALLLATGNPADRLPKGQASAPDTVRALEVTAVIGARQGVAIVKVERSSFAAKAAKPLDGAVFRSASLQRPSDHGRLVHTHGAAALNVATRHKAYRARPPPPVAILST